MEEIMLSKCPCTGRMMLNGPQFFLFNTTRVPDWYPKIGLNRAGHGYQSGI